MGNSRFHLVSILLLCLLLYFPLLGIRDFWDFENRWAEVTRVMLLDGNYAILKVNGELWADKPPLFFWLAVFFSRAIGRVNEWTMRFPSAISATASVLIFYLFSRKRFGAEIAFHSALVLATSLLAIDLGRHVRADMVFFLFFVLSMFFLMEVLVFDSTRLSHIYGFWLFAALACLTKGPLGIILPGIVGSLYIVFSHRWRKVLALRPFTGSLLFLGLAVPWYAFVIWKTEGEWAKAFFMQHNIGRYLGWLGRDSQPFYYYAVNFPVTFIPWSFLFVPAAISLWPDRLKIMRDDAVLFLFLWFSSVFLFFQFSDSRHSHYLFPIFPPAALAVGVYLVRLNFLGPPGAVRLWTDRFVFLFCLLLALAGVLGPVVLAFRMPQLVARYAPIGFALVAFALWLVHSIRGSNYRRVIYGLAALMVTTNLLVHGLIFPWVNSLKVRPLAEKIGAVIKPEDKVGIYREITFHNLNFYSRIKEFEHLQVPDDVVRFLLGAGPRFIVAREKDLRDVREAWKGELIPVVVQNKGSKRWYLLRKGN